MALDLVKIEPHFESLLILRNKHKNRKSNAEIFALWENAILPDAPKITFKQFTNHLRYQAEAKADEIIESKQNSLLDQIEAKRDVTLVTIEKKLRVASDSLVDEAVRISEDAASEDGAQLKERYFALTVIDKMWGKLQKEKEIAIKAHAEKRESVGMFAKLLRGALSGDFTMQDVENLQNKYNGDKLPTTERVPEGVVSTTT